MTTPYILRDVFFHFREEVTRVGSSVSLGLSRMIEVVARSKDMMAQGFRNEGFGSVTDLAKQLKSFVVYDFNFRFWILFA